MWKIAIPTLCVLAHLYLVLLFLPAFWREIDQRGFRWHHGFSLFVVPALVIVLIGRHALANLGSMPDWLLVTAFIAIDALVVAMVLAAIGLSRRRKRRARDARDLKIINRNADELNREAEEVLGHQTEP